MPFGTITNTGSITVPAETFEPTRPGVYPKTGSTLNAPVNELRFSAAAKNSKAKRFTIGVVNIEQQDFTPAGSTVSQRDELQVNISVNGPRSGAFTEAEIVSAVIRTVAPLTADRIRRMLLGEN